MNSYRITGGKPLYGSVRVGGAKNASFKLMIASLLANSASRLLNFSHISDVFLVATIIKSLGATADQVGERAYSISPTGLHSHTISSEYGEAARASTMFIPILLHRFGEAQVPFPGGDKIGARTLERHFDGLVAMGATVETQDNTIVVKATRLKGTTYRFIKNSHTGTETMLLAAVMADGTTILENAAEETEVDDLIAFLNAMGGQVKRTSARTIEIKGVPTLHGAIYKIMPDANQVVSFACAALATKGDVIVENARPEDLGAFFTALDACQAGYEIGNYGVRFYHKQPLQSTNITTGIHPAFKTDWQPLWVTLMTQAEGTSVLHETIHESRFAYVDSLRQMGAQIELFNPPVTDPETTYNFNVTSEWQNTMHAARITGPSSFSGGEFTVMDLRHGATLMIAGLLATGETLLHDPDHHIDRGYELLDTQFRSMGATIEHLT